MAETIISARSVMSMRSNFASNSQPKNFGVALILQALQISFVLTPTRGAEARWGLLRAPNPPECRFFTPPVALFCRLPAPRRNNSVVTVVDTVTPDIPLAGSRSSPPSFSGACSVPGSQAHRRHCSRGLQIWNLSSEFSQRVRKVAWRRTRLRSCRLGESPPSPASSRPTILE